MGLYSFLLLGSTLLLTLLYLLQGDGGYLFIRFGEWHFESSLTLFLILLLTLFALFYLLLRLFCRSCQLPGDGLKWYQRLRAQQAARATTAGLIALAEGKWRRAERLLTQHADISVTPLINYLGAAHAAQELNREAARDEYLAKAYHTTPDAELAVGLTQARVQLSQGQREKALATLRHLQTLAPKHPAILKLLSKLYLKLGCWHDLLTLLPTLRKQKLINDLQMADLELEAHYAGLLASEKNSDSLKNSYAKLPNTLQQQHKIVELYAQLLLQAGDSQAAADILGSTLKKGWQPQLMRLYGSITVTEPAQQRLLAEQWLEEYQRHPELLLALGRICNRCELWGKARHYLEASLGFEPRSETYYELAKLLEQLNDHDKASDYYREGLKLAIHLSNAPSPSLNHHRTTTKEPL
ncbi:MAG: tetratricopeptide repeat protein [Gammaproteobacteria bacterium]|nr:tetratricopeptide repeat protein [Gammaproteobacteria bacterium]